MEGAGGRANHVQAGTLIQMRGLLPTIDGFLAATPLGTVTHVDTLEPIAALTFDDGPHETATPAILDLLDEHNAKATFFVLGDTVSRHPNLVREIARRGHAIGNHTFDHPHLVEIPARDVRSQIRRCRAAVEDALHREFDADKGSPQDPKIFRPPRGYADVRERLNALWLGYTTVTWSFHGTDWEEERTALDIAEDLLTQLHPGAVVVLHDGLCRGPGIYPDIDRTPTVEAVECLLRERSGTYEFLTVPALLRRAPAGKTLWRSRPESGDT